MLATKLTHIARALVIAGGLSASAFGATVSFDLDPYSGTGTDVEVMISDIAGGVQVTGTVNAAPNIGDLLGLFFSVDNLMGPLSFVSVSGGPVTASLVSENNVSSVGSNANNTNPRGGFDIGVRIGTQGMGQGDDFQSTVFNILGNIEATDFTQAAARLQSVGLPGGSRGDSGRLFSDEPNGGDPPEIPEPSTYILTTSALVGVGLLRRRLSRNS